MRIVVHDYAGHAFTVELSRKLAERGHEVLHMFSTAFVTPQGRLTKLPTDAETLYFEPIALTRQVDKNNYVKRRQADIAHGKIAADRIKAFKPEVILSGNTPLDAQVQLISAAGVLNARFVFWVQDLIGQAALRILGPKIPVLGSLAGQAYIRFEHRLLRSSHRVVVISEDFKPWIPKEVLGKTDVVENWAPLDEIGLHCKSNEWSLRNGLSEGNTFLYSGTIGKKHDPSLLTGLAQLRMGKVVVISEGENMDWLKAEKEKLGLDNLHLFPFQPFAELPMVLATADVLVAILEPDAGVFSVPSKVLSYLCAGRALLLSVPPENLAARIVTSNHAGKVVAPGSRQEFLDTAASLMEDTMGREEMGRNARAYAARAFDLDVITARFEKILAP